MRKIKDSKENYPALNKKKLKNMKKIVHYAIIKLIWSKSKTISISNVRNVNIIFLEKSNLFEPVFFKKIFLLMIILYLIC